MGALVEKAGGGSGVTTGAACCATARRSQGHSQRRRAAAAGLINQFSGRPLVKAKVHQILHNPLYYGDFVWIGKQYRGLNEPLIPRVLFDRVQEIFDRANRPRYSKHGHPFTGLLTCARCGCAITAELKKGQYLYYHCTGAKGPCGNSWIRDTDLLRLLADVIHRVHIPGEIADRLAEALRESQADKKRFSRTRLMRLQQQQLQVQAKIDRAYDDRLSGTISEEMWARRSSEWETEINQVRGDMARLEDASRNYTVTGLRLLELARNAYPRFNSHDPWEQAKLLKMVLSNCTFDRGSLCPAYNKPFDIFAGGNENGIGSPSWIRTSSGIVSSNWRRDLCRAAMINSLSGFTTNLRSSL